jgi:hypothetical protein
MQFYETLNLSQWTESFSKDIQAQAIANLEKGKLLFFPQLNFALQENEKRFLSANLADPKAKNISFDTRSLQIKGAKISEEDCPALQAMLLRFADHARQLIHQLLPHYIPNLIQARTSFRPVEVSNRKTSYRKDDRLLHVDAFPANPNRGQRLLRVFSNVNHLGQDRVWRIGEPFEEVAKQFLPNIPKALPFSAQLLKTFKITKSRRSEYDHIMLHMHNRMKANSIYQKQANQTELRFPPGSTWIVQTDHVSHAAMQGQFMLEQTFYLPVHAMLAPQHSPLKILERLTGKTLN